jgi:carbamoylphosphate synthase large subunit
VELYDGKQYVNDILRSKGTSTMPNGLLVPDSINIQEEILVMDMPYPVVAKMVRGRESYGVKVCHDEKELIEHTRFLFKDSPSIVVEEYLAGKEMTITVMPLSQEKLYYWSMLIVTRFNHNEGIALHNGTVAVASNSRVVSQKEYT